MNPEEIRRIAESIADRLAGGGGVSANAPAPLATAAPSSSADGIFANVDDAIKAARAGFIALSALGLEQRKLIIESMRVEMRRQAEPLARMANEETGLGRFEDKVQKNLLVTNKTPGTEDLSPIAHSGDDGFALIEPAPFGVIGAITPVTNPPSTIICNSIAMPLDEFDLKTVREVSLLPLDLLKSDQEGLCLLYLEDCI